MKIFITISKIFLFLVLFVVCGYAFLIGLIGISWSADFVGYKPLAIIIFACILISFLVFIAYCFETKKLHKITGIIFLSFLVVFGILLSINAISNQIKENNKINEVVDITKYEPFQEPTKLATLNEKSALTLTENLPRLDGSSALYPVYSAFARSVYPKDNYNPESPFFYTKDQLDTLKASASKVLCSQTYGAYHTFVEGLSDIIFTPDPPDDYISAAKDIGVNYYLTPIGREAFVFVINSKNKVNSLTSQQLKDIYSGKITNWSEIGGSNGEILAYQRPSDSGSQTMFEKFMQGIDSATPPQIQIEGMDGLISQVADYTNSKNAIGYSFRYYATTMDKNNNIKLLAIDGIYPSIENIKNGTYPLSGDFYAITNGEPTGNSKLLIDWILSPQGQELIEKTGYVPIN